MGTNRLKAIKAATILLAKLIEEVQVTDLVQSVLTPIFTVAEAATGWLEYWKVESAPSSGTITNETGRCNRIAECLGALDVKSAGRLEISKFLDEKVPDGEYIKYRSTLMRVFQFAMGKGYLDSNPVELTLRRRPKKRKRGRLSEEQYQKIYERASPHLKIGMRLVKFSLQRPGDLCSLADDAYANGKLTLVQSKTGTQLEIIPIPELAAALEAAQAYRVEDCAMLMSYLPEARARSMSRVGKKRVHWAQVFPKLLNEEFMEISRNLWPDWKNRATFYEIKSLGFHWYESEKKWKLDEIQQLAGHDEESTSEIYADRPDRVVQVNCNDYGREGN